MQEVIFEDAAEVPSVSRMYGDDAVVEGVLELGVDAENGRDTMERWYTAYNRRCDFRRTQ